MHPPTLQLRKVLKGGGSSNVTSYPSVNPRQRSRDVGEGYRSKCLSNMIPLKVGEIVWGVAAAQRLYGIGFQRVNNAGQNYRDFGDDIRLLAINLDLISSVVQQAQKQAATFNEVGRLAPVAHQVLGNYRETLIDCERLLDDQRYFTKQDGFVTHVSFFYQNDPEVQLLRDRIVLHNFKLSISLKILDSKILGERFIQICDPTNTILGALEQLGQQIRGGGDSYYLSSEPPGPVTIPKELEDGFRAVAHGIFPDLSAIPLDRGVDTAAFHFNKVTKTLNQLIPPEIKYLISIINIMMAVWLIRTVRAGQYYHNATQYWSPNTVDQLMNQWGMTMERFFNKFEENLYEAFRSLLGPHSLLPPIPDLLEIFENERIIWQGGLVQMSDQMPAQEKMLDQEPKASELGIEIMSARLKSLDPSYAQTMQLYRLTENCFNLLLVQVAISEGRDKETTDSYDLQNVQIIPAYAMRTWTSPPSDPQTIRFRANGNSPIYRNLIFDQNKDMFQFQEAVTKYKVVHDDSRVLAASQEAKFLGGMRRQDLCRLQIWTSSPPKDDVSTATQALSPVPLSATSIGSPQPSFASIMSSQSSRKGSTFTLSAVSSRRKKSSTSASSTSSDPLISTKSAPPLAGAAVFTAPVTPCVVLFSHKVPDRGEGLSRSFLIIDVNPDIIAEAESIENDNSDVPSYRCVLERKGSYLSARRSPETSDPDRWDLAVASQHRAYAGTETVKRLKHVIIQFDTPAKLSQFVTKFKQVQDLAKLRLAQFLQSTGDV